MKAQLRTRAAGRTVPPPSLSIFLERVGHELQYLTGIVAAMQEGLSPVLNNISAAQPETCRHAQSIDLVWQTLSGLAEVMAHAARDASNSRAFDIDAAVAGLPLAAVANRLRGIDGVEVGDDLDLF